MSLTDDELAEMGLERSTTVTGLYAHHAAHTCAGGPCSIHRPSPHPLNAAPLLWRADRGLMERTCRHGVGHPDPDGLAYDALVNPDGAPGRGVHGCDGCCADIATEPTVLLLRARCCRDWPVMAGVKLSRCGYCGEVPKVVGAWGDREGLDG